MGEICTVKDLLINIEIPDAYRKAYAEAAQSGDLARVKAILLKVSAPHMAADIERFLPSELTDMN